MALESAPLPPDHLAASLPPVHPEEVMASEVKEHLKGLRDSLEDAIAKEAYAKCGFIQNEINAVEFQWTRST
ncbi:hypothetical protein NXY56_002284 [Leishmania guyanensis]|uniref:Uncharacterized protein n=1 Tax=Leishmania shawi TaxID=5680 RepID=A0AAW3C052_9TRYP